MRPGALLRRGVAGVALALATVAAAFHGYRYEPWPAITTGRSIAPLEVYESFPERPEQPGPGHRTVRQSGQAAWRTVIGRAPIAALHVTYARVEGFPAPSGGQWLLHLVVAEKDLVERNGPHAGRSLVFLRDGEAVRLDPAWVYADRDADFYVREGSSDEAAALAFARTLTDAVDVVEQNRWSRD